MDNQVKLRQKHVENGVVFVDLNTVYLREDTEIASGVVIEPFVVIGEKVKIGKGTTIKAFSYLENVTIGENALFGPYARTRGECKIGDNARVGNFVEVVRSTIGDKSHIDHLSYVGDSKLGVNAEIGCGFITCNYNGFEKNKCDVGDNTFIGSNVTLVAPVVIEEGAMVAAGSLVASEYIEKDALVIARTSLVKKPQGAVKYRHKKSGQAL